MILPTKRITQERCLLGIGADILTLLETPKTLSKVWDQYKDNNYKGGGSQRNITYDWFVLAVDLLYMMGALTAEKGLLRRTVA